MSDPVTASAAGLTREVAELRHVVLRLLDIMEDDKRRSMRNSAVFIGFAVMALILLAVLNV